MNKIYPTLPDEIEIQLKDINKSINGWPVSVKLKSGKIFENVYLAESNVYFKSWGLWPEEDSGKNSIDINDIESIWESPNRLPIEFATTLYNSGESGMGYCLFSVTFWWFKKVYYVGGNAVDFINYPKGLSSKNIRKITPHDRTKFKQVNRPEYYWALYTEK